MRLAAFALTAFAITAQTPKFEFDVATVKASDPGATGAQVHNSRDGNQEKLECLNLTLKELIMMAYRLRKEQVFGGPAWTGSEHFDIQAKYEAAAALDSKQPLTDAQKEEKQRQFEERIRSLLVDRFQLSVKLETKEMPVYVMVAAKGGPKLQPAKDSSNDRHGTRSRRGTLTGTSSDLENLANALGYQFDRPVLDKTGIKGRFDYQLDWTPDPPPGATPTEISGPSIFTALQDQLGLKLESQKVEMPFLTIERAEKPSAN